MKILERYASSGKQETSQKYLSNGVSVTDKEDATPSSVETPSSLAYHETVNGLRCVKSK
jgi:hypothetical protein